jgi:NADPH:quinone reductase-like Zn-dependent oxidoreductase
MRAFELKESIGFDGLIVNPNRAIRDPAAGQVKVRVRAASVNYRDLLIAKGAYRGGAIPHCIPLSDGAGEVAAVGPGVTRFKPGDRVIGAFFEDWAAGAISAPAIARGRGAAIDGMLAEYAVISEHALVRTPAHLSDVEAATLPCAAVTAWNALVEVGRVRAGETVLILGTGGVALFALQLAKLHGAQIIVTSGSDEKIARVCALGADETINYVKTPDWDKAAMALTSGRGADLVIELGGPGTLERSIRSVRTGGTVALIGVVTGAGQIDPRPLISRAIRLQGVFVGSREMFEAMNEAIATSGLKPVIDKVFAFDDVREAYRRLEGAGHFGKVVVTI